MAIIGIWSNMKVDLHVHSKFSKGPSQWILQKIGCPESFTEPMHLRDIAIRKGMSIVTITDHNITERQHQDIQKALENIYDIAGYLYWRTVWFL
jgi:predicted metal-dependent phosphoesterase TrpH